jgi:general secretion pathway protein J
MISGPRTRSGARGMTLVEVMVAIAVLAMVSVLIYGVVDSLSRGRKGEAERADRVHQLRDAVSRIMRDMTSAYLSTAAPSNQALLTRMTAFVGRSSVPYGRVDFTAFAHLRTQRDAHESDQAEVGYFVVPNPDVSEEMDLVRREQSPIDLYPLKGGIVSVVAEGVQQFSLKYLDPVTGNWLDTWDTTQVSGQPNRLPLAVRVILELKGVGRDPGPSYTTKFFLPVQQPLSFANGTQ